MSWTPYAPRLERPLPGKARLAANATAALGRALVAAVRREPLSVPDEVLAVREAMCRTCEWFRPSDERCSHARCGCNLKGRVVNKLRWATEKCPDGRWTQWREAEGEDKRPVHDAQLQHTDPVQPGVPAGVLR